MGLQSLVKNDLRSNPKFLAIGNAHANIVMIGNMGIDLWNNFQGWRKRYMQHAALLTRFKFNAKITHNSLDA